MFKNTTLLITGGTGSFGNAVLTKFLNSDIKEIRIFSRDEKKQDDMRRIYQSSKIKYFLGDVRDKASISNAMIGADLVFHAAALKQVPSCEFFPFIGYFFLSCCECFFCLFSITIRHSLESFRVFF